MTQEKEQDYPLEYEEFFDRVEANLCEVYFDGEYRINMKSVIDDISDEERIIVNIAIDSNSPRRSQLGFSYIPSKRRLDHVRASLRGDLQDKGHDFLYKLEDLAREMNCTEMRTLSDEEFWKYTDWFRYKDGTYRKCLRPEFN